MRDICLTGFIQGMFIVDPNPSSYDGRLKQLNKNQQQAAAINFR